MRFVIGNAGICLFVSEATGWIDGYRLRCEFIKTGREGWWSINPPAYNQPPFSLHLSVRPAVKGSESKLVWPAALWSLSKKTEDPSQELPGNERQAGRARRATRGREEDHTGMHWSVIVRHLMIHVQAPPQGCAVIRPWRRISRRRLIFVIIIKLFREFPGQWNVWLQL